jgi:hypothetical protein
MAYRPVSLAPVLGLGHVKEQEDDGPSFARVGDLPLETKHMIYKYYFNDLDTIYSCEYKYDDQPALLRQSAPLRAEALPVFYSHSIFAAEVDMWPPICGGVPPAHLDDSTEEMLFNLPDTTLCRIRHLQLTLDFDRMEPLRRFVVKFDLTQWNDFDRAIRIERIVPTQHVDYVDTFRLGIQRTMRLLFDKVPRRQYLHGRPRCDDVLFCKWLQSCWITTSLTMITGLKRRTMNASKQRGTFADVHALGVTSSGFSFSSCKSSMPSYCCMYRH